MDENKELQPLKSKTEVEKYLKKISSEEQIYSIALFDILGFSNFVEKNRTQVILELYNKLLDLIHEEVSTKDGADSFATSAVPVPITKDWKQSVYIAEANAYINVCHFSDTFLIYVNYHLQKPGFWLSTHKNEPYPLLLGEPGTPYYPAVYEKHSIYLSFLQTCMEFFCQAIISGIPLRGCISTGLAIMDQEKSIYLGTPIVEAARGKTAQNAIGIAFGRSFNNSHPVYNDYFIPYMAHIKEGKERYMSPMMVDWARYWRNSPDYKNFSLKECIEKMNTDPSFSSYYDNAIRFFEFSKRHEQWFHEIKRDGIHDILSYYDSVKEWYDTTCSMGK